MKIFSVCYVVFFCQSALSFLLHWSLFICNFKGIWTFYLKTLVVFNDAIVFCDVVVHVYVYVKVDYPNFRILEVVWWIYILECTSYQCVEIFLTVLVIHLCTKLNILPVCLKFWISQMWTCISINVWTMCMNHFDFDLTLKRNKNRNEITCIQLWAVLNFVFTMMLFHDVLLYKTENAVHVFLPYW